MLTRVQYEERESHLSTKEHQFLAAGVEGLPAELFKCYHARNQ